MKILIIGSGGREHALAWKISQSPIAEKIFCAPGNAGTTQIAQNIEIGANETQKLLEFALKEKIGLTVVGPEDPLSNGIVDEFEKANLKIFGPQKKAAMLEASKAFSKQLMKKLKIPTAGFLVCTTMQQAKIAAKKFKKAAVKADGLCAGKGVVICRNEQEIINTANKMLEKNTFGAAGKKIVIEELLNGQEASILAFCDQKTAKLMVCSQDHKRVFDNDAGANTGGMGAYSPTPLVSKELEEKILQTIFKPVMLEMSRRKTPFKGVLYAGLMISCGEPKVLEFNCRFGDPETQVIIPRLKTDLVEIMLSCTNQSLEKQKIEWHENASTCVVLASNGYPEKYEKGKQVFGLEKAAMQKQAVVFHAGTKKDGEKTLTNGGRVLGVTATGKTIKESIKNAYNAVAAISFEGMHFRKDIGKKAVDLIEKETIRKKTLAKRQAIPKKELAQKSEKIAQNLFLQPEVKNAKTVFCYLSFASEAKTNSIITKLIKAKKKVIIPKIGKKTNEIIPVKFTGLNDLQVGAFGILEPKTKKQFTGKIDLIIMPGVAFDLQKNRIGFGKGYFDRFLSKLDKSTPTIALAFDLQMVKKIPASPLDIKVKKIITETKVF